MVKVLIALALSVLVLTGCSAMNQRDITCTVIGKESVPNGDSGNQYRVYTEQCDTLVVEDTISKGRFDSADVYARIEVGKTYLFHVGGYRQGFLSMFPNILNYQEVSK